MTNEAVAGGRALVTGASGFIGTNLCRRLCNDGVEVHGVSRFPRDGDVVWWEADLRDADAVARLVRDLRPELVIHLAGHVSGSRALGSVLRALNDNLITTVHVLLAAAGVGCRRLVLAGSMEEPSDPADEAVPASPYAAAKLAAGAYARMLHALHAVPAVNLRMFMVYGPGPQDTRKLVPYTIASALRGQPPKVSSGTRLVDWVYVDDVVNAVVQAASVAGVEGSTIDVGSGTLVSIHALVEAIVRRIDPSLEAEFGAVPDRALESSRAANVDRTRALLGWEPRTNLDDGLDTTIAWYAARQEVKL
jgi:UDP-glucose 4-epimerase